MEAAGRAVEARVAEAEHAAVRREQPVAAPGPRRGHRDDRLVQVGAAHRAVEARVAEAEHAAVRRRAASSRGPDGVGASAMIGALRRTPAIEPNERRVTEREDVAAVVEDVVAVAGDASAAIATAVPCTRPTALP